MRGPSQVYVSKYMQYFSTNSVITERLTSHRFQSEIVNLAYPPSELYENSESTVRMHYIWACIKN